MTTGRRRFRLASPGGVMLVALLLVLAVLPLGLLLPVVLLAAPVVSAVVVGIALFVLLPTWILLAYTLLWRRVELDDTSLFLRAGPWRLHVARSALENATFETFSPLDDPLFLADRRASGIDIGSISVGRFRHPDGRWSFKLLAGPGEGLRITDASGTRIEMSLVDPLEFIAAWSGRTE